MPHRAVGQSAFAEAFTPPDLGALQQHVAIPKSPAAKAFEAAGMVHREPDVEIPDSRR
jgi:hypothetical protein